jgi:SAM-dependent methyltransferase
VEFGRRCHAETLPKANAFSHRFFVKKSATEQDLYGAMREQSSIDIGRPRSTKTSYGLAHGDVRSQMTELSPEMKANQANWNDRVAIHLGPNGYDVAGLVADPTRLSMTVQIDAPHLGPLEGLHVAHLQCHIGNDTLSLTRLGATCVGLDFSADAIGAARALAAATNAPMTFVESPVYDALDVMERGEFDLVYATCGAINWLPDIGRWAKVVAGLLRPGGRVYLRDSHPILFALDEDRLPGEVVLKYPYTERGQALAMDEATSYTGEGTMANTRTYEWNHSVAEIVQAMIDAGLTITAAADENILEWEFYPGQPVVSQGQWGLPSELAMRIPLMLRIQATKN